MVTTTMPSVQVGELEIEWAKGLLEPRPWTAAQAAWAAELLDDASEGPVLELCAGAGHIGLLSVLHRRGRRLVAVDRDPVACEYALRNAVRAGIGSRVEVRHGLLDSVLAPDERFALVVADPPWVPRAQVSRFPLDPVGAIDGGDDGLEVARQCVALAGRHLLEGGSCLLQLGDEAQVAELQRWLSSSSGVLRVTETRRFDPNGVVARLERERPADAAGPPC
ncbi:class I SAM-dependent methyltransferase [Nocardioides terrisoli]|uniref:class I SAM-dependent methyltransferase n=1 Tax=Nocardioides terrisoli TaxID=3388267 RepID=UPI00287B932D|nr:class I SAM-dependent methyltransferase [Nocardioides marmorisolisilvae]